MTSLVPQIAPFEAQQIALFDELYAQAELDAVCAALFTGVAPGETLPPR
jgi:hypothetical protein